MRKLFFLLLALVATTSLWAQRFQVGDLYYNITSNSVPYTVEVSGAVSSITSAIIPSIVTYNGTTYSVTSIGYEAFRGCSLTSITIPNSVISIGYSAFRYCSSLTSITIPNSVTSIGGYAFSGCSLTSVTIGNSVTSIGNSAFELCSSLTSITIPNSVTSIGECAFRNCSSLITITIPNSVTSIGDEAFEDCSSLTSITIPNSVTSIGDWAFSDCSSLTSVTIPNSVTSIGRYAFHKCSSLTSVTIPNSVKNMGAGAFSLCEGLTKTNYTGDVAGWCNIKFGDASSNPIYWSHNFYINDQEITDLVIPNTVDSILDNAFNQYVGLTSVTIPNSVTSIGEYAFRYCSLTSVTIPNSVTSIGNGAFEACYSLISITIPSSVTSIEEYVFGFCNGLTSVTIPNSVTSIEDYAFYECSNMTSLTIGDSVMTIGKDAFGRCYSLTSIIIPNSVTSIGRYAFRSCDSLTSVTIGNSVTNIGYCAFDYCNLKKITSLSEIPPTLGDTIYGTYVFGDISKSIPIYVPCGCVDSYSNAEGWNYFSNIQERLAEYTITITSNNETMGTAQVDYNTYCNGSQITATANYGYHFVQWSDGNTYNPRKVEVTKDTTYMAEFAKNSYTVDLFCDATQGSVHGAGLGLYLDVMTITAAPNIGYRFVQWSDGNTDNPRTFVLTKNTSLTAKFAQVFSGQCGDNLYWNYDETTKTISITGSGKMYDYTATTQPWILFKEDIKEVTICNKATSIGISAFEGCISLGKLSIGSAMKNIAADAFAGCKRLYDIYIYATYPPFAEESSFANYDVYVYVPCEYQRDYTLDVVWGKFKFIECIGADNVENTEDITITPGITDVTITWPTEEGADTYTIVIKKDGEVVCTHTFNAEGQLLNIAFAPGRDGNHPAQYAEQAANGYRFTVTGLEEGTDYTYDITVKDASNKTIKSHSGKFTTESLTAVENTHIQSPISNCQKILRNGQLLILRDGVEYNAMGAQIQ